jgi:hypothetical protein
VAVTERPEAARKPRWPYFGAPQKRLVLAGFGIWIGTALPWFIFRPLDVTRHASPLAASWVLWAGLMVIAGAVARWKVLALLSALAGGATAFTLAVWQMLTVFDACGGVDFGLNCVPGPGVFVVQGTAAVAIFQGWLLLRMVRSD